MSDPVLIICMFAVFAAAFGIVGALLPRLTAPNNPGKEKGRSYECGVVVKGDPWSASRIQFYLFALIFLVFDVEALFLFPWAVVFRDAGWLGFAEMLVFLGVLVLGWGYAWRTRALEWE